MEYENGLGVACRNCGGGRPQYYELRHTYTDVLSTSIGDHILFVELSPDEPDWQPSDMGDTSLICSVCGVNWPIDWSIVDNWEIV